MKNLCFFLIVFSAFSCKLMQKAPQIKKPEVPNITAVTKSQKTPMVLSISGKYLMEDTSKIRVYVRVELDSTAMNWDLNKINENFLMQWSVVSDANIKEKLKYGRMVLNDQNSLKSNLYCFINFEIPKLNAFENVLLNLEFVDKIKAVKYTNTMAIDNLAKKINTRYEIFDSEKSIYPKFDSYLVANQPFVIKSAGGSNDKLFLKKYVNKSLAALSPMSSSRRDPYSEFEAKETIEINNGGTVNLPSTGVYVLSKNPNNHLDGYSILVVDGRFPRNTDPNILKEPLVYLSTQKEAEALKSNPDAKDAIDNYFLNLTKGNQDLAKGIIRNYYRRVTEANTNFSTYKEGWKTDKGMVFIVMGSPTKVQKNKNREVWVYSQNKNSSEIIYTFYQKPNDFSDQVFELVRYPEYSSYWYPNVEAWRIGKTSE